jgi:hypothetical protein
MPLASLKLYIDLMTLQVIASREAQSASALSVEGRALTNITDIACQNILTKVAICYNHDFEWLEVR